jgi:hypothetical protein
MLNCPIHRFTGEPTLEIHPGPINPGPAPARIPPVPSTAPEIHLAPFAKEAFTVEILAVVVLFAATVLYLVGSVPRARAGSTPAGSAT